MNSKKEQVTILGSTGSIGENTLDVIRQHRDKYQILALSAASNVAKMARQCQEFQPQFAVMIDDAAAEQLETILRGQGSTTTVLQGAEALTQIATLPSVDIVMAAIVGSAGLSATLAAVQAAKKVLLANKETLIMAGQLVLEAVRASGALLLPVDSEHSAIFQCLGDYRVGDPLPYVDHLILTASGGPFRQRALHELADVTPEQALAHPTWVMGPKISIDSATMMNKGLEVIEAHWLFAQAPENIRVLIHPESIVHSLVAFTDGSQLAQLGNPDMRVPISVALAWPRRLKLQAEQFSLVDCGRLSFNALDLTRFPAVALAYQTIKAGGTAGAILNAANEVLVEAFLQRRVSFLSVTTLLEKVLENVTVNQTVTLDSLLAADQLARETTHALIAAEAKAA